MYKTKNTTIAVLITALLLLGGIGIVVSADVEAAGGESVLFVSTDPIQSGITITAEAVSDGFSDQTSTTSVQGKVTFRLSENTLWYIYGESVGNLVSDKKTFKAVAGESFKINLDYEEKFTYTLNFDANKFASGADDALSYADDLAALSPVKNTGTGYIQNTDWESNSFIDFCYYGVFDPLSGDFKGKLKNNNLSQYIDGRSAANDIKTNNVMWCIPTTYITSTASTLTLTNDHTKGDAPAHTMDDWIYEYYGIAVYECTIVGDKLLSISDSAPTASKTRAEFRDAADNNVVKNGHATQWNFPQQQLFKLITISIGCHFDSQKTFGSGSTSGNSGPTKTGTMNGGMYYGSTSNTTTGVKYIIENAHGSLSEFVDDVVMKDNKIYIGQHSTGINDETSNKTNLITIPNGGYPSKISTNPNSWGIGIENSGSNSNGTYDYQTGGSGPSLFCVGGSWGNGLDAGVSCIYDYSLGYSRSDIGARLAYVFDADAASVLPTHDVTFDVVGGSIIPKQTVVENSMASEPAEDPTRAGYKFMGWYANAEYTGLPFNFETTAIVEPTTLYAKWIEIYDVTFETSGGTTVEKQNVVKNEYATEPAEDPGRTGYRFDGWYANAECTGEPFNFKGTEITSNTTIYAKWLQVYAGIADVTSGTYTPIDPIHGQPITFVITPLEGYNLPNQITITIGGHTLKTSEYLYNKTSGEVAIAGEKVTGDVSVHAVCEGQVFKLTLKVTDGTYTSNVVDYKKPITITLTPREGFKLPTAVKVTIGDSEYLEPCYSGNKISIPGAAVTGDVVITVVCEEIPVPVDDKAEKIMIPIAACLLLIFVIAIMIYTGHIIAAAGVTGIMIVSIAGLIFLGVAELVW